MFRIIAQIYFRYWVSEYNDSPEYFDYSVQATLIASSEEAAIAEVERLSLLRPSSLRYDERLGSHLDGCYGDIERANIWYEELIADI